MALQDIQMKVSIRHKWLLYTLGVAAVLLDSERLMTWVCERCAHAEVI